MHCFVRRSILSALLLIAASASASIAPDDPLMKAMEAELGRSFRRLKTAGGAPLYFLAYRVYDTEQTTVSATNGALDGYGTGRRYRSLDVEVRVGSAALDNTHRIRKRYPDFDPEGYRGSSPHPVPLENDEGALRAALWAATDAELKRAQKKLTEVKANKSVLAEEEDHSGDFSVAKPAVHYGKKREMSVDRAAWEKRAREVSAVFRGEQAVQNGSFYFSAARVQRTYANSEGTRIQDDSVQYRITLSANGISDDGMTHWLYDDFEVPSADLLPSDRELAERARKLAAAIRSLRVAPLAEPFAGPAILSPRAANVFFHEIFGHRVEGHRQK